MGSYRHQSVLDFEVLEETEDYIAVSKPAPLIVHPTDKKGQATLLCGLQMLLAFDRANGAKLSIINRLDRETSGVVLVAKNQSTARAFNRAMERREVEKTYLAIMVGNPSWKTVTVEEPIGNLRDIQESAIWLKQAVSKEGKEAVTKFTKKRDYEGCSLIEVTPKTGRMHQIRVHAAHLGHPLVGDKIYGPNDRFYLDHIEKGWTFQMEFELGLKRQALHAVGLNIMLNEEVLEFNAPLASDLVDFLSSHEA